MPSRNAHPNARSANGWRQSATATAKLVKRPELARRRAELDEQGGYQFPQSQTPWQGIQRNPVDQLTDGMVLKPAVEYQRVAQRTVPRNSH